ncbi:putative aminotransferase class-III [Streptomyces antimycoticus]|uniref:L-lysine-epsilon aminotransferase n=1 Tax=Streptomyces antimycoticus TaxID=68175 RepID=A0A499UTX4_9ACTN|nr:L-lysine 6-transaminase [Streptomyces antimycoticus]BBJ37317.1 putative aminotransferase class-III [Streptomyces antimycoticus]
MTPRSVPPQAALDTLRRHVRLDGFDLVLDLGRSSGSTLVDARDGAEYLDLMTFSGSLPLGMNHPDMAQDARFMADLAQAALHKVTNPDIYTAEYARFVDTFTQVLGDPALPHLFFIDGGALAVENALKTAFDWKARRTGATSGDGLSALHLEGAFHGRSGYTLSLTNAGDRAVTDLYPALRWPRIPTPGLRFPLEEHAGQVRDAEAEALRAARRHFAEHPGRIACFIAEPVQGAGGDVHLSSGFLYAMQELCREHDALFVLDEVQTGCGMSGSAWCYQRLGLEPDVVAFGKKTQVCGIMAGRRVDGVPENALAVSSRLGSTWGGNLVDMVRATRILEIVEDQSLIVEADRKGAGLLARLRAVAAAHPEHVSNVRGRGLICAFDMPDGPTRDEVLSRLRTEERVLLLPGGERGIRFRPSLAVSRDDLERGAEAIDRTLAKVEEHRC